MRFIFPLILGLYLVPALISSLVFELYPLWVVAALSFALFIGILGASPSRLRRGMASAFSWLGGLGSVSLLTSLALQGEGFNTRFFYHYTLDSLKIGLETYPMMIVGSGSYMLACIVLPLLLPKTRLFGSLHHKTLIPSLGLLSGLIFPPAVSGAEHIHSQYLLEQSGEMRITRSADDVEVLAMDKSPKNIILIYAESLESLYFDEDLYPGLVPQLNSLRADALEFTNAKQVSGTGWTMAGLVASQCSLPFNIKYFDGQEAHVGLAAIDEPFKDEICLADILDAYGYETVFMGGAPLSFAGKGKFLETNGFDQTLGLNELQPNLTDNDYRHGWGLYDDSLLSMASQKIDALEASNSPYLLSVLTVDTHQPKGHIPKDCVPYSDGDGILHAVHCSDRVIGDFIKDLRARDGMEDTLIVLFSDHLSMYNTEAKTFAAQAGKRRLAWMVWGDGVNSAKNSAAATHFDVTPTILEMAGIPNYRQNNWGQSVLGGEDGYWFSQKADVREAAKDVSYLDMQGNSALQGIRIDAKSQTIFVGDKPFIASRGGFSLGKSIFMLLMTEDGAVDSILFADDLDHFNRIAKDYAVIAVSLDKVLAPDADSSNQAEEALYYYIGTPSKGMAEQGMINKTLKVKGADMRRVLKR